MLTAGPDGNRGRVLVVDDRMENRELLLQELEEEGFEVRTAASGQQCLEIAETWGPEVILLDINMPGMDGIETCKRLKSRPETSASSVLFVTALRTDDDTAVRALAAGGNDFLPKPYSPPILLARVQCQLEISRAHARLRTMAMIDELTGVFSRRFLFDSLRKAVKGSSRRQSTGVACLVADVDHFKRVNDRLGHIEGDRVLRLVAQTIKDTTRETDVVARFGGEEFVVVLSHTDRSGAIVVAEKIRSAVSARCTPVTISVGVASLASTPPEEGREGLLDRAVEDLLRRADDALLGAKALGRNRVEVAADSVASQGPERRAHERLGIPIAVQILDRPGKPRFEAANLSSGGLALVGADLQDGDTLRLSLQLGAETIEVRGLVVWTGKVLGVGARCGIAFDELDPGAERVLTRFLAGATRGRRDGQEEDPPR